MPTTTNKQRILNQLFAALKKRYEPSDPEQLPVLEQFLYAICREGASRSQADRAYRNLRERFFDWNEVRVSSAREVEEALGDVPQAENRAHRLISFLQEVFETTYSFDLESLHKKGLKQAAKQLGRYQAANDYAVAWVTQQTLGGHAIPTDSAGLRVLGRLGLVDDNEDDLEALRASLEHLVPKAKGSLFIELVSALASEVCWEDEPACSSCPLLSECPTGQEMAAASVASSRTSRAKPR
jgi:endonuclease III